jgi:hypothetical protein
LRLASGLLVTPTVTHTIIIIDALTLITAAALHRRYPMAAYEDVGLLVLIGALMLALGPPTPGLVISAAGWGALAIKTARALGGGQRHVRRAPPARSSPR